MEPEVVWILAGILLIVAEFVVPGLIVIFFGFSALVVGLLIWAGMPGGGALPFLVFSGVSIGSLLLLRKQFKSWFVGRSMGVQITGVDDDFVGHEAVVVSGFSPSQADSGRVAYRGTQWDARAVDGEAFQTGDPVKIVSRKGPVLIVERK